MPRMRKKGLSEVLTNDRHFEQERFRALISQLVKADGADLLTFCHAISPSLGQGLRQPDPARMGHSYTFTVRQPAPRRSAHLERESFGALTAPPEKARCWKAYRGASLLGPSR
jgi:hypothetical protein